MNYPELWSRIEATIARHDLLQHPFYKAWTAGTLTKEDLRRYSEEYYHQVSGFPTALSALHSRLPDGELRRTILRNLCEEEIEGTPHSELWLDFAEGMGADREATRHSVPSTSTANLVATFRKLAEQGSPLAALGAFYAYESQVARIAGFKADGLREKYDADAKACNYFTLHSTWDVHHANVWKNAINKGLEREATPQSQAESEAEIVAAVEKAAVAMWKALDGISELCCVSCN